MIAISEIISLILLLLSMIGIIACIIIAIKDIYDDEYYNGY